MFLQYGRALEANGRPEEALRYITEAVENRRRNRPGTRYLGQMIEDQALVLIELGQYQKAEQLLKESEQIHVKVGKKPEVNYLTPRLKLAIAKGDVDDATALLDRQFGPIPDSLSWSVPLMIIWKAGLSWLCCERTESRPPQSHIAWLASSIPPISSYTAGLVNTGLLEEGQGRLLDRDPSGALPLLEQAVKREAEMLDPSSPELAKTDALLGIAYLDLGDERRRKNCFQKPAQFSARINN